jgi:hypothetical protein
MSDPERGRSLHLSPMQIERRTEGRGWISPSVTKRAYEVYSHLYGGEQTHQRLHERGGFGAGELIAFLYARSFPKDEWRVRSDEAFHGMKLR